MWRISTGKCVRHFPAPGDGGNGAKVGGAGKANASSAPASSGHAISSLEFGATTGTRAGLLVASMDGSIRLLGLTSSRVLQHFIGHDGAVSSAVFGFLPGVGAQRTE